MSIDFFSKQTLHCKTMLNELSSSTELDISYEGCIIADGLQAGPLYLECRPYFLVSNLNIIRSMY